MIENWEDIEDELVSRTGDSPKINGDEHIHTCFVCDKRAHLYVNYRKGVYNCYACGTDNEDSRGHIRKLARLLGVEIEGEDDYDDRPIGGPLGEHDEAPVDLPEGFEYLTRQTVRRYFTQFAYLMSRGLDWDAILYYGIGVAFGGRRIVFPDYNKFGQVRWWQGRALRPNERPKYQGPEGEKGGKIGHYHRAVALATPYIGVCEGPISGIIAGPEFTWLWGKEHSQAQVRALVMAGKEVVIAMDGEAKALDNVLNLSQQLRGRVPAVRILPMPVGHDPASLGRQCFRELLDRTLAKSSADELDFAEHALREYV